MVPDRCHCRSAWHLEQIAARCRPDGDHTAVWMLSFEQRGYHILSVV